MKSLSFKYLRDAGLFVRSRFSATFVACNRAVTTAALLRPESLSEPVNASPGCTGVHSRSRLYIRSCVGNGVPELGSEVQVLALP
jgi:hypothetical protein